MFSFFKKKNNEVQIKSCCKGIVKDLKNVNDPVFSEALAGPGLAIVPTDNKFYSPVSGVVETAMPSKHAFGIKTKDGLEFLIHIGINTVELNGTGFKSDIKQGDTINEGDLLCEVDLKYVKEQGKETDTMVLCCTPDVKITYNKKDGCEVSLEDVVFSVKK